MRKSYLLLFVYILPICLAGCSDISNSQQLMEFSVPVSSNYEYVGNAGDGIFFRDVTSNELLCVSADGNVKHLIPSPDEIKVFSGFARCKTGDLYLYITCDGEKLPPDDFAIESYNRRLLDEMNLFQDDKGLWGYTDRNQKWIIMPQFSYATLFDGNLAYVECSEENKNGFINKSGELVPSIHGGIPPKRNENSIYDTRTYLGYPAPAFFDGCLLIGHKTPSNSMVYTYFTESGHELPSEVSTQPCGCPYALAKEFSNGVAAVQIDGLWGYIDTSGKKVIAPQYKNAFPFLNEKAIVQELDGTYYFIDMAGDKLSEITYIPVDYYPTGLYYDDQIVVQGSTALKNVVDSSGNFIFDSNLSYIVLDRQSSEDIPVWELDEGFYLPVCKKKISRGYSIQRFGALFILDDYCLFDALNGKVVVKAASISARPESSVAVVCTSSGKYGYINSEGEWLVEPIYDFAGDFCDEIAYARKGNNSGIIFLEDISGSQRKAGQGEG